MKLHSLRLILLLFFLFTSFLSHSQVAIGNKKRGRNVIHNADGSVSVGRTKRHYKHGTWYNSYPNHQRKSIEHFHLGKPVGVHLGYWPNGQLSMILKYGSDHALLVFATFDQNGDTTEYSSFANGERSGYHYLSDTITHSWSRGMYLHNQKTGTWTFSSEDSLVICNYTEHKMNGAYRAELYDNRVVTGYYKNDLRDSVWRVSMNNHLLSEHWYCEGKKCKIEKLFFANSDSVYCETRYRAPGEASQFIIRQQPGIPGKTEWYSNFIVDSIHLYFPNGKLQSRSIYRKCYDGKPVVHWANFVYDENGKLLIKTLSGPSGKDSLRYDYTSNGTIVRTINFKRGNINATTYYYDNGNIRVRYVEDSIQVYSADGKKLRMATPAYGKVFAQIDSIENSLPGIPIYTVPDAPEPPYNFADANEVKLLPPVLPSFPGGVDSLRAFLLQNMKYPQRELEQGINGKVDVQFIVEADGSLTNIQAINVTPENNRAFKAEAIRLVKAMPKWKPGAGAYGPERVLWTLPIRFSAY